MTDQTITGDLSLNGNLKIDGKINTGTANANTHFLLGEKAYLGSYSGNDKNYLQMSTTSFKIENDDTLQVAGNLNAQGTFVTAGMAVQSGAVTFSDKAVYSYIDNNGVIPSIESQGSVVVNKSLSVGGTDTNYLYDVSLNANTFVAGDLSLNGNLVLNGTVTAPDNSIPASAISGATDTDYTVDISMDKTLTVGGDASFNGNVVLDKQLTVTADTHLNNRLFLGTSDSPSDAIIYGNTYVNKNLHIYGNLKVDTLENVHNLTVNEYQHITAEDLSMNGRLFVSGDVSLNDDVYIKGGLTIDGSVTAPTGSIPASAISGLVGADYTVDISMDKTLTVGGDASFNGNVVIDGTLKVNDVENNNIYNMRVTNYSLIIAEDLSLNNRLFVMQDASFNEDVHVAGDLNVDGSITNATWTGDAIADQYISSAATWNAKQSALTFGTANTNAVTIDGSTAADDSYARFTANGIEGRTPNNVKIDLGLENVTNESKATMFTSPTFTGTITVPDNSIPAAAISGSIGADYTIDISMDKTLTVGGDVSMNGDLKVSGSITDATWTGVAIADNYISSANAWNAKQDALTFSAPGDNNTNPSTSAQIKTALDTKQDTLTFNAPSYNNTNPSTSAEIKTALDLKQDTITGGATTITSTDLTNSRALVSNASGKVDVSVVTSTELGYLNGVTTNIQTQIDSLQTAGHSTEFAVTVATKTSSHPYYGSGSTSGYKIDGIESPVIEFKSGYTYKFDQSDGSNIGHPIRFYLDADKTTEYTTSVSSNGSAGNSGAYVQIIVGDSTPTKLFYQCANHVYMGYYSVVELASTGVTNTELGYLNDVTSAIQSQIDSKQAALTFGISDTNAVKIDGSSAVDDSYVRFTASGIEGRTTTELKTDVGLNNVTNESKSTMFDAPTFTNKVTLNGDLSLNQNLYINGDASFNGDVTIVGNLKADKIDNEYIINTETVNYTLIVAEDLSLNNRLFIQGDASFNEDVHIDGNLTVSGTVPTWNQNTTGTAAELSGTRTAKYVYAAPNDADGTASFRELVASDIPTLNQNTTGTADGLSGTHTANHVYAAPNGSNGSASFRALVNDDIPTLTGVDIDGGAIDGTAIGANSASTAKFTTLNASDATTLDGTVTLGNAAGDAVTVEGTITVKNTATFNGVIHQF
jgi:cytoskeletal protein CcmA (bactofilin family)